MALTPSNMLPLGTPAPAFNLPEPLSGRSVSLRDFTHAPALVVMFICNHCPYVKHLRRELAAFAKDFQTRGVAFVGINSNDVAKYPDDSPEKMKLEATHAGYTFPYLFDESQAVAKAYQAACTPDFYVFNAQQKLVYRGQFDASRPKNGLPITGQDLGRAIEALLEGKLPATEQSPSIGCNIKWRS